MLRTAQGGCGTPERGKSDIWGMVGGGTRSNRKADFHLRGSEGWKIKGDEKR